jgi:hypothetical protein
VWVVSDRCEMDATSRRGLDGQDMDARVEMQFQQGKGRPRMFHVKPRKAAIEYLLALLREDFGVFGDSWGSVGSSGSAEVPRTPGGTVRLPGGSTAAREALSS